MHLVEQQESVTSSPLIDQKAVRYQHRLYFQTAAQTKLAVCALLRLNIVATNVRGSRRCKFISFQARYELGPVMRGVLCCELQPVSAFFNRQPQTWKRYPVFQRVTRGQIILTTVVFLLFCAVMLFRLPRWNNLPSVLEFVGSVAVRLSFTVLVACISPDIFGLMESSRAYRRCRMMVRRLAETKIPMGQEGNTMIFLQVSEIVGMLWQGFRIPLLIGLLHLVGLILHVLHVC